MILFDNTGVGGTTGKAPDTVEQMAADAIAFLDALGVPTVDIFGFSLGGFVAQELALTAPGCVRQLVLAGTGPKGAPGMEGWAPDVIEGVVADNNTPEGYIHVFYTSSPASLGAGQASAGRIFARQEGRDALTTIEAKDYQYRAVQSWGIPDWAAVQRLTRITQRTLVLQGDSDIMILVKASVAGRQALSRRPAANLPAVAPAIAGGSSRHGLSVIDYDEAAGVRASGEA